MSTSNHAAVAVKPPASVWILTAGFEGFYRGMGAAGAYGPDAERLVTTAARYGCEITGPSPEQPRASDSPTGAARSPAPRGGKSEEVSISTTEK